MNWSLIDAGTFDYAADAWGYTYGAAAEWYQGPWTVRGGVFDLSITPNNTELDPRFAQFQMIAEVERRYEFMGQPGRLEVNAFLSRGRMGRYSDAIALASLTGAPADTAWFGSIAAATASAPTPSSRSRTISACSREPAGRVSMSSLMNSPTSIERSPRAFLSPARNGADRMIHFGLAGVVNGISSQTSGLLQCRWARYPNWRWPLAERGARNES